MRRVKIVHESNVYLDEEIATFLFNEDQIINALNTTEKVITWLAFKLIKNSQICALCSFSQSMVLRKKTASKDGYYWFCSNSCKYSLSIRKGSIFEKCKLPFLKIFRMIYKYLNGLSFTDISFELKIHRNTAGDWCALIREIIAEYLVNNSEILGCFNTDGTSKIVEIDESLFFKRKYQRGRLRNNQWYIGGIERGTRKVFMVPVENRNRETIYNVLCQNVANGTIIITDEWRAYGAAIRRHQNYEHRTINHSLFFVDPDDDQIHTQNVEGLWFRAKFYLRKKSGLKQEEFSTYLIKFLWEYKIEKRFRFAKLLNLLVFKFKI
jgi:transposase-like protein